ncbi:MFS transporter [Asaia sp. As-1742]|uniref:MFS transporter n=1 Tax=Asaia sp. As-1742 TaxID=2608325 RepID=UPI0014207DBD|nr:MFS transporter [Asaia sp. As-1742]
MTTVPDRAGSGAKAPYLGWVLLVTTLCQLGAGTLSQGIGVWGAAAKPRFHLSDAAVGILAGLSSIATIFGLFVIGRILDHRGERGPIAVGLCILSLAAIIMAVSPDCFAFGFAMILIGIGYVPIQPGGTKAVLGWFPPRSHGLVVGVRQAALPLSGALIAYFLPRELAAMGWKTSALLIAAFLTFICSLFWSSYRNYHVAQPPLARKGSLYKSAKQIMRIPGFSNATVLGISLVSIQTTVSIFWVIYLQRKAALSLAPAADDFFRIQMAGAAGRIILSWAASRFHRGPRRTVILCCVGVACLLPLTMVLSVASCFPARVAFGIVLGFFVFGWYGPWVTWLAELAPPHSVGEMLGLAMAFNQIAIAATPFAMSGLIYWSSTYITVWLVAEVTAIMSLAFIFVWPTPIDRAPANIYH